MIKCNLRVDNYAQLYMDKTSKYVYICFHRTGPQFSENFVKWIQVYCFARWVIDSKHKMLFLYWFIFCLPLQRGHKNF